LGKLPLVPGMPIVLTQNLDVQSGAVNGARGTLVSVRYTVNSYGEREAESCVVKIEHGDSAPMSTLDAGCFPVMKDKTSIQFSHR
ncbi:hypothetical protein BDN70DRAFT_767408, partial [Pholiota conissans]